MFHSFAVGEAADAPEASALKEDRFYTNAAQRHTMT